MNRVEPVPDVRACHARHTSRHFYDYALSSRASTVSWIYIYIYTYLYPASVRRVGSSDLAKDRWREKLAEWSVKGRISGVKHDWIDSKGAIIVRRRRTSFIICIFKTLSVFLSGQPRENITHVRTYVVASLPRISFEAKPEIRCLILALSAC